MPIFNYLFLNDFIHQDAVNAALSTCHFDSVDIVTP